LVGCGAVGPGWCGWRGAFPRHRRSGRARPWRLAVTEGNLDLPGPSGPVRIPDRRVIAQARVAFEVRLDNREARRDGAC
jgi:hypothetical protein